MNSYCLDTSAYSHFKRGDPQVVDIIDSADWLGIPAVVVGELGIGFRLGARLLQNECELQEFLANPIVEQLIIDSNVARIYSDIFIDLRKAGTPIPSNDIWIAALAVRAGVTVLTYDAHFSLITRVGSLVLSVPAQ